MISTLSKEINTWCSANLTKDITDSLDSGEQSPDLLFRSVCKNGWMQYCNILAEKENFFRLAEVCKVTNSYSGVLGNMICVNAACAMLLATFGDPAQKLFAKQILDGDKLAAFSLTEPQAGTDVNNIKASAILDGDEWLVQGEKYLATGAMLADSLLVVVKTKQNTPAKSSSSMFLIPANSKGLEITPIAKMSANGYASCRLKFDNCRVPFSSLVGQENGAWAMMSLAGGIERVLVAACCVGLCKTIGEYLYQYANERTVSGMKMYELINIKHQIVDIAIKVRAADGLVNEAIRALISGKNPTNAVCSAKSFAAQMQQEVSMTAMNVMGGRAYLKEYPVERWLREGLLSLWAGGTNELQKNLMSKNPFV